MITVEKYNDRLDSKLFENWLQKARFLKFDDFNLIIDELINKDNIDIIFSDEIITENSGFISCVEMKNYIKECYKTNSKIKDMLKTINDENDLLMIINDLNYELVMCNDDIDEPDSILDTLIYLKGLMRKKGRVYSKNNFFNKITIYVKALDVLPYGWGLEEFCEIVFIKELFNLVYKKMAVKVTDYFLRDGFERNDYISKVIKESLSTYFVFRYCEEYKIDTDFINDLRFCVPALAPASGFTYITSDNEFKKILEKSLTSMDEALRILLGSSNDLLYSVINHNNYKNSVLKYSKKIDFRPVEPYDFMIDFEEYLNKSLSDGTVKSYISWISSSFKTYLGINVIVLSVIDYESRMQVVSKVLSLVTGKDDLSSNQRSALHALEEFIKNKDVNWHGIDVTVND